MLCLSRQSNLTAMCRSLSLSLSLPQPQPQPASASASVCLQPRPQPASASASASACLSLTAHFGASGAAEAERRAAPPHFGPLVAGINIPLMRELARESGWHDAECIDFCTRGAPLLGSLARSCNGRALGLGERPGDASAAVKSSGLRTSALVGNASLLSSIRADPLASELLQKTRDEAEPGRMSPPWREGVPRHHRRAGFTGAPLHAARCTLHALVVFRNCTLYH